MATYIWAGSTGHKGGYGHPSWTGGTDNKNYLSGVTCGFYWNDPRNWLEEFQGVCGGVSGGWTGDDVYYGVAQNAPGAGDVAILKEIDGGEYTTTGPGVGVTGTYPKAPLLFGGYVPSTTTSPHLQNKYANGGGWLNSASGGTGGKLSLFRVENSYLNQKTCTVIEGCGYRRGRFPVGVQGDDVRRIEQKTQNAIPTDASTTGGTFSGVQLYTETFIHEGERGADTNFVWDDANAGGPGGTGGYHNFSINLIHSIIDTTHINGFNAFDAMGVTFDQLFIERINLPKSKWDGRGGGLKLHRIPENSIMPGRPYVGCRVIDHADGSGYLRIGGLTGGPTLIKLDETVPKIDVTTNFRRRGIYIDAPTITTLNLYPEGSSGVSVNPTGQYYGEHQPVILMGLDHRLDAIARYTTVTTCNLEDTNPVYGGNVASSDVWYNEGKDITVRGTENRLAINKGVTFDNLNIKGGRVHIGLREDPQDAGHWRPPTGYGGAAEWDIGQVRVTDGELHEYVYINCNHPNRPEWKKFEIGGCVSPCTKAGFKIISNGSVIKWQPDMYVVADTTVKGSTGGISLARKG